jgi:hypothetical protein
MVVTNHCGSDVCRFTTPCDLSDKGDFYLRQITGSVNYTNGGEIIENETELLAVFISIVCGNEDNGLLFVVQTGIRKGCS